MIGSLLRNVVDGTAVAFVDDAPRNVEELVARCRLRGRPTPAGRGRCLDGGEIVRTTVSTSPSSAISPCSSRTRAGAEAADRLHVVADEEHGPAVVRDLAHPSEAALLELGVADREHLVDDQDVRLEVRGDREAEAHVHPARVALDRRVDVLRRPRRTRRSRRTSAATSALRACRGCAPFRKTFSRPVSSPRGSRCRPRAARRRGRGCRRSLRRLGDAREQLQQRRLPGAVPADDRDRHRPP